MIRENTLPKRFSLENYHIFTAGLGNRSLTRTQASGNRLRRILLCEGRGARFVVRMGSPDSSLNQLSYPPAMGGKTAILSPSFGIVSRSA
jgi:hypothetical protein